MIRIKHLALVALVATSLAQAETKTLAGNTSGEITSRESTQIQAAVGTESWYTRPGENPDADPLPPFKFDGDWSFTWNSETPDKVEFTGDIHWGDHITYTDAGSVGGVTAQHFHGIVHKVGGTANWDPATRTLTFEKPLGERNDAGASTVTESKKPSCEGVKGMKMMTNKACNAFYDTSPGWEGFKANLVFSEDLQSFKGTIVGTQYGGSGFTKSQADMTMSLEGKLSPQ